MKIYYNPKLKELARQLRNNATQPEIKLQKSLRKNQMYGYDFHRQKPIDQFIVDFFCNTLQLIIECDGYSHEILEVYEKDVVKTKKLNQLGIHVLRFSDNQKMNDLENVLRAMEDYILTYESNNCTPPSIPPY